MWCIAAITPEYEERMLDVLEVYERPYDQEQPVICCDEKSVPLRGSARTPQPMKPGKTARRDYEYTRNGTANLFVTVEPKGNHREVTVTARRTKQDFAREMKRLADDVYPDATTIVAVVDNLNTHFEKSFDETFSPEEAARLKTKFEFHHTPKHASWLNMAEIEIGVVSKQCLNQDMETPEKLMAHTHAWVQERNEKRIGTHWTFTREKAREKFKLKAMGD